MKNTSGNTMKRSLLMTMILGLTAMFSGHKKAPINICAGRDNSFWNPQAIFSPPHTKFKGWMRSNGMSLRERRNKH